MADWVATGVTSSVGVGIEVGAEVGVELVMGRKRAASTPTRVPKRIKAIIIKKVFRKPDFLDDEGAVCAGRGGVDGVGREVSGCVHCSDGGVGSLFHCAGGLNVGTGGVWFGSIIFILINNFSS